MVLQGDNETTMINKNGKRVMNNLKDNKRFKTKSLYRQPTANELNRLQETETLFNSNLFRLQVEEVLQEVKISEKTEKKIVNWFEGLTKHLESIPEDGNIYDLSENTLFKKLGVKLPVSKKLNKTRCTFRFSKFQSVEIAGSYILGCSLNSKLHIDLQIIVPAQVFTKNDSINYRYHKKRAAYLAYIASHLTNFASIQELNYTWLKNCETRPIIDLKPSGKLAKKFSVRINLICEMDAYKLHRFSPDRNNLRESWLFSVETHENQEVGPPTPYYNSSILTDLTAMANHEFLKDVFCNCDNLKQAVMLIKIWLKQRNLEVSGHIVSLFVAYLVNIKRINNIMSSYQIVRNIWIAWKSSEWDTKGITLHKESDSLTPSIEEFHQYFPVVFIDRTGFYNLCWQMCKGTYMALKRESSLAVEMLDNVNINSFIPLFMTPVQNLLQFDHILRFKNLEKVKELVIAKASKESRLNYGLDEMALVINMMHRLFEKGLGNRADLILQLVDADFSWSVKKKSETAKLQSNKERISFGFVLNSEYCFNNVEKGPSANLPEAEEFRSFWGDKSELRRFQDGSITETCVWEGDNDAERRTIIQQILDYLLNLKYGVGSGLLYHVCSQLDRMCGAYADSSVTTAFDSLRRDLRALTQLPLEISALYGVSPVFSYSDPCPPQPRLGNSGHSVWQRGCTALIKSITKEDGTAVIPEYTPVCKAVIELGHSGKWPGDVEAFRCLKAAFHLQICDRLQKDFALPAQAYPTHVDVMKEGYVFRLTIGHPKEITLLRREMKNGVVTYRETEESINLQCETILMPRLRGVLHGLHSRHSAFGPACCIFKRWLSCHLLCGHFPTETAELLAAAVFLRPQPAHPPTTPLSAFLRILKLLAHTDWSTEIIILDFNNDMKREEVLEIERKFTDREQRPAMVVVTSHDGELPGVWSERGLSAHTLARARALAGSTLKFMEGALDQHMKDNVLGAFVPSLSGYDVLLHLRDALVPYSSERVTRMPRHAASRGTHTDVADVIPVVEFNPVRNYLQELRSAYSDFAMFFYDKYGGDVIAVLWKPDIHDDKEFQILNAKALTPLSVNGDIKYKVNVAALIEDFRVLGEGLIRDITINS